MLLEDSENGLAVYRSVQKDRNRSEDPGRRLCRSFIASLYGHISARILHTRWQFAVRWQSDCMLGACSLYRCHGHLHELHMLDSEHIFRAHRQHIAHTDRSTPNDQLLSMDTVHLVSHGLPVLRAVCSMARIVQAEYGASQIGHEDHTGHGSGEYGVTREELASRGPYNRPIDRLQPGL